ncbi:probable serine/threonine-protein kinase PBL23 [Hibiscus syriacus]|uniref:probable serine/threonine-protein kinase PBL23 n=1 Tax=Hibiscus syriacus TaxID=106335 RepID=UPI001920B316|nr:probable serine/threonine-protein kinase PBL23 [Hibiscus syriacus]
MSWLSCCRSEEHHHRGVSRNKKHTNTTSYSGISFRSFMHTLSLKTDGSQQKIAEEIQKIGKAKVSARIFTFREILLATDNFNSDYLIGEGGFGRVYQGYMNP